MTSVMMTSHSAPVGHCRLSLQVPGLVEVEGAIPSFKAATWVAFLFLPAGAGWDSLAMYMHELGHHFFLMHAGQGEG